VDWNDLQSKVLKDSTTILSFKEFKNRIQLLFSSIDDKHAALFINGNKISANDKPITSIRSTLINELKRANPQLRIEILEDKYGYILIPPNSTRDNLPIMAQAIQDSLCTLLKSQLNGIIIDLRANDGGSIYPMFTGLSQLIGDGVFGAFNNIDGTNRVQWKIKNGKIYQRGKIVASVKTNCSCSKKMKVAVLLSQLTASAGEMVAIALKGRKNTIFIGEKTYGLTTGNVTFKIDGHLLALSASFTEDRTGKVYNSSVLPDIEIIEGDNFSDISIDRKVLEAIQWFSSHNSH
jgi:C-terminal processing protease CtpA/Prc